MAEPVVVTCCAAPGTDMARKNAGHGEQVMSETQQDRGEGNAQYRRNGGEKDIGKRLGLGKVRHGPEQTKTFLYIGGQDTSRGQARIHKQRWL